MIGIDYIKHKQRLDSSSYDEDETNDKFNKVYLYKRKTNEIYSALRISKIAQYTVLVNKGLLVSKIAQYTVLTATNVQLPKQNPKVRMQFFTAEPNEVDGNEEAIHRLFRIRRPAQFNAYTPYIPPAILPIYSPLFLANYNKYSTTDEEEIDYAMLIKTINLNKLAAPLRYPSNHIIVFN